MSQRQIWLYFQFSFLRVRRRKKTEHYMQNLNGARVFYFVKQISSEKHALLIHVHVCTVQCTPVYKWKHMFSRTHFVCKCMWRVCGCVWKLTRHSAVISQTLTLITPRNWFLRENPTWFIHLICGTTLLLLFPSQHFSSSCARVHITFSGSWE